MFSVLNVNKWFSFYMTILIINDYRSILDTQCQNILPVMLISNLSSLHMLEIEYAF